MMVVLGWILRIIVALVILRIVFRFLGIAQPPRASSPRKPRGAGEIVGGTLVRDPQCGTYIPQAGAVELPSGRGTRYFCSAKCRDTWSAAQR